MRLPLKIAPCPIQEAVFEIRFNPKIHGDAVFGIVSNAVKELYDETEELPVLQIPPALRTADANLIYLPHYRLKKDNNYLLIGPRSLAIGLQHPYPGWTTFFGAIQMVFEKIKNIDFIDSCLRFGIRYINLFDVDIFNHININIQLSEELENEPIKSSNMIFRSIVKGGQFNTILTIGNDVTVQSFGGNKSGSIIDLDTHLVNAEGELFLQWHDMLNKAHLVEKQLFFRLLKSNFLLKLNPVYEE